MISFKAVINESASKFTDEVEDKILKLNPKKFAKDAESRLKDGWYWSKRPNILKYEEQNNISSSYSVGSLYDVLRNYRFQRASKKVQDFLYDKFPFESKISTKPTKIEGVTIEFRDYFKDKLKKLEPINPLKTASTIDSFLIFDGAKQKSNKRDEATKTMTIKSLNFLNDTIKQFNQEIRDYNDTLNTLVLVLIDEVAKDYIIDTDDIDNVIKAKLNDARTVEEYRKVLNDFQFKNIPDDIIIAGLMDSKGFTYSTSSADGYGHTTGTKYTINFFKKAIYSEGWSSDD